MMLNKQMFVSLLEPAAAIRDAGNFGENGLCELTPKFDLACSFQAKLLEVRFLRPR